MKKYGLMWASRESLQDNGEAILAACPGTTMIHYGDDPATDRVLVYLICDLLPNDGFNGFIECQIEGHVFGDQKISFKTVPYTVEMCVDAFKANLASIYADEMKNRQTG